MQLQISVCILGNVVGKLVQHLMLRNILFRRTLIAFSSALLPIVATADDETAFFENRIRPVLATNCYECHSMKAQQAGKLQAGLLLDTRVGIRKGGDSGPAIVPGNVEEGSLLPALRHETFEMPPKRKLSDQVVADFARWIEMGAPDPRDGNAVVEKKQIDVAAGREFWSLQPLRVISIPVAPSNWSRTAVDRFVELKRLEAGLPPVPDAQPRQLIRRLYFDLIGLPPRLEEVREFEQAVAKDREAAVANVVDRLLESSHFGERWGRHWLDIARYGETSGGTKNADWPDAWRYRDYVIRSFNEDKPYDQFIREQLAGDLIESSSDIDSQTIQQGIVATGFLAMGANKSNSQRMEIIGEQLDTVGRAVLGVAIGCARCHDHKFDPIPTEDFYAMAGIFINSEPKDQSGSISRGRYLTELDKQQAKQYKDYLNELRRHTSASIKGRQRIQELLESQNRRFDPLASLAENIAHLEGKQRENAEKALSDINKAHEALDKLKHQGIPDAPIAIAVEETGVRRKFANSRVHIRGNEDVLGQEIPRNTLQMLSSEPSEIGEDESGRRQLADLIATHPLAARVIVNRVWHHLFGRGIVRTVDNLGTFGEAPTHPELLEYLANRLVESGWSLKAIIREIVLSRSYQLSAAENTTAMDVDSDNTLLWRHAPRRRDAEALRDAILFAAGTLRLDAPSPWEQLNFHSFGQDSRATIQITHRAVYLPVMRGFPADIFAAFNFPPPDLVVGRRETSSVPTQALFMINSPLIMEQSQHMAQRRLLAEDKEALSDAERVRRAYQLTLGRDPTPEELQRSIHFVQQWEAQSAGELAVRDPWAALCQALFCSAEFRFIE